MGKGFLKKYRWCITISLILTSIFLLYMAFIYKLPYIRKSKENLEPAKSTMSNTIYSKIAICNEDCKYPFVQTDIPNIFYTASPKKGIKLYKYESKKFNEISNTKNLKISLTLNGEKIPVVITYIVKKGKVIGYGTHTSTKKDRINNYAFFKLCNMPKEMCGKYDTLLLVDFDSDDIFKCNKTYSEIFQLSSRGDTATRLVSENNRKLSINDGKLRNDFSIVTDYSIKNCKDKLIFLSSRNYKISNGFYGTDLYCQKSYTKTPTLIAQDIHPNFFFQTTNSISYLKSSKEENNSTFSLINKIGNKNKEVKIFNGKPSDGYKFYKNFSLNCSTMTLYNLINNTQSSLLNLSVSNIEHFAVSPDKNKVVIMGKRGNGKQKLIFYNLQSKKFKCIRENDLIYEDCPNLNFIDNDKVTYIKPSINSDGSLTNTVISFKDVFSKIS